MVSMVIVNNEQCVVGNKHYVVVETTRTAHSKQTRKHKGGRRVTCVLAELRAHYTTPAIPQKRGRERKTRKRGTESSVRRVEALVSLTLRRATT